MSIDWLIVGLGNPGPEYSATRHNIGYRVAERLVQQHKGTFTPGRGPWLEASLRYARKELLVALPTTYMNRSGVAVRKLLVLHNVPTEQLIVIVDEYNFPVGRIQLKLGGSDGGHNGIASIIEELGTECFWRLRCGIGRDFGPGELVSYVLAPFPPAQEPLVEQMIADATSALELIARIGIARASSQINALAKQRARHQATPSHGFGGGSGDGSAGGGSGEGGTGKGC